MKETDKNQKKNASTEQKIKDAARIVFIKKGYAATRTRDIAEEANLNLALLNYYFRSKQKLFEIIMIETFSDFIKRILSVLNDKTTSFDNKIQEVANRYIDLLIQEPEIPTFILTEIRNNPEMFAKRLPIKQVLEKTVFSKQYHELVKNGTITEPNLLHFMMNTMGLILFPFLVKPMLIENHKLQSAEFNNMMLERKKRIPFWIKAMMEAT